MDRCVLLRVCFSALESRARFLCRVDPFLACSKFYAQVPQRMLGVKSTLWCLLGCSYWMYKL